MNDFSIWQNDGYVLYNERYPSFESDMCVMLWTLLSSMRNTVKRIRKARETSRRFNPIPSFNPNLILFSCGEYYEFYTCQMCDLSLASPSLLPTRPLFVARYTRIYIEWKCEMEKCILLSNWRVGRRGWVGMSRLISMPDDSTV